jgi:hypothetical protein
MNEPGTIAVLALTIRVLLIGGFLLIPPASPAKACFSAPTSANVQPI